MKKESILCSIFMALLLLMLTPFCVFAGGVKETKTEAAVGKGSPWHEAPMLHQKVLAGELPPLEKRLPKEPMVEQVHEEIGQYGGEWHFAWNGTGMKWTVGMISEESLFRFAPDGKSVVPNVAKGVDINEDYTEFTIHLREGMKWSDGEDFDADDCLFFWEHMLRPGAYGKKVLGYPAYYTIADNGEKVLCEVEKIDRYTFKITHAKPYPTFLERMAIDTKWFWAPEHYHRKLLPEFIGEEKALQIAKEKGFGNIKDLGNQTGYYYWLWPERPVIRAWKAVNHPSESRYILERNPYYFKTDPEGNQLPYIDRIVVDLTEDDLFTLKAISGELDCQTIASSEYTLLMENVKKGDYRVVKWKDTNGASDSIQLNQTVKDPGLRKLFQDIRFRAGLSVAINREEINEIVHGGLEIPRQASLLEGLPHFSATWAKKFAEYDPDRAARYFDEVGLPWDKGHKYRLRPDGSELVMIVHLWAGPTREKVIELVKSYWEAVGIKTIMKVVERAFLEELRNSNDLQIGVWGFHILDVKLRPDILVPLRMLNYWSGHYGPYYESKGKMGIKPEGDILLLQEYWNKAVSATTKDEMNMWADKIVALHEKNVWAIGITGGSPTLYVVKNNFRNFPEGLYQADELRNIGVANPCQFFIRQQ